MFKNLVGGQWIEAADGSTIATHNPADPKELLGVFPSLTRADARVAVDAAAEALPRWAAVSPPARGAILYRASELLAGRLDQVARTLTQEEGKTLGEARGEVQRGVDVLRYYAAQGWHKNGDVLPSAVEGQFLYTRREPLGVVSVITPWNYPFLIPMWKIAPALAYGNTVVFKPASFTPHCGLLLTELFLDAGLPPGVLNFVTGSGSVVGDELVKNPQISGISFTGSYDVGQAIYQQAVEHMTRIQLEMGGKNALIVLKDADLSLAVDVALKSGFGITGQACTAASRIIVEDKIATEFTSALVRAAESLVVGNGLEDGVQMGPAAHEGQFQTDLNYLQVGLAEGAKLLTGGDVGHGARNGGYYIQPTVFADVQPEMRIAQEEIFGPIVGVIRAADFDDAIEKANNVGYGLSAGIITQNLQKAFRFAEQIEAGIVKINEPTNGVALNAPFGGFKHSSANTFKEQGQAAAEFYTRTKTVYVRHNPA